MEGRDSGMDDVLRSLGRVEAKLDSIHESVSCNCTDIKDLQKFRSRCVGVLITIVPLGAMAGTVARIAGVI